MPTQIGDRSKACAEPIHVRHDAGEDDREHSAPLYVRKKAALQCERGESVGERVHGTLGCRGYSVFRPGNQQPQRVWHNAEFYRKPGQWFAVHLRVGWGIALDRFANQAIGLPKIDALFLTQIAEPQRRQIAQILQAALGGQADEFELVLEEVCFGGDFKWAAIMFGAANDHQGDLVRFPFAGHAKVLKFVVEDFAYALQPVGKNSEAGFQLEVNGVSDASIGARAGNAEKVASLFGMFERSSKSERDIAHFAPQELLRSFGNIPGEFKFFGENVCSARG